MPRLSAGRLGRLACLAVLAGACGSERPLDPPVVSTASPPLFCSRQLPTRLDVTGGNFEVATAAGGASPAVWLERIALLDGSAVARTSSQVPAADLTWGGTAAVSFPVAPLASPLDGGVYAVWVQNPDGAWGSLSPAFAAAAPPALTSASVVADCTSTPPLVILSVTGTGLLRAAGATPVLTVVDEAGTSLDFTSALLGRCAAAAPGLLTGVEVCRDVTLELAPATFVPGLWSVRLTNPAPAACGTTSLDLDATGASCP